MPRDKLTRAERDKLRILVERRGMHAVLAELETIQERRRGPGRPRTNDGRDLERWLRIHNATTSGLSVRAAAKVLRSDRVSAPALRASYARREKVHNAHPEIRSWLVGTHPEIRSWLVGILDRMAASKKKYCTSPQSLEAYILASVAAHKKK